MKMRHAILLLFAVCVVLPVSALAADSAKDLDPVPFTLAGITDPSLRDALKDHSPNYDELGRGSQIFTYVDMYRHHNHGISPALNDVDISMLEASGAADSPAAIHDLSVPVVHDYKDTPPDVIRSIGVDWFDSPKLDAESVSLETVGY